MTPKTSRGQKEALGTCTHRRRSVLCPPGKIVIGHSFPHWFPHMLLGLLKVFMSPRNRGPVCPRARVRVGLPTTSATTLGTVEGPNFPRKAHLNQSKAPFLAGATGRE